MPFLLHHDRITAPDSAPAHHLLMLHGAFGSGRNWSTVAKNFVARRPDWGVLLIDLREHGHSVDSPPPHTLAAAAEDMAGLIAHLNLHVPAILGHSFGGKVAMQYLSTLKSPTLDGEERAVRVGISGFIIDSTPDAYQPTGDAWQMLHLLRRLPASFATRHDAIAALRNEGLSQPVAQWMAMNIHPRNPDDPKAGYGFRLDLDNLESLLRDFYGSEFWPLIENPPAGVDLHFVRATRSSIISDAAAGRIRAAAATNAHIHLHEISGGHWLNVDNPDAIVDLLARTV